jgi:hypothetical protein
MGNKSSRPRPVFRDPYPDRQGEINQKMSQLSSLNGTVSSENVNVNVANAKINSTIAKRNQYVNSTNENQRDYPIKSGTLHSTEDQVLDLNNRKIISQDAVGDTLRSVDITRGGQRVTTLANADATNEITAKMLDTIEQTKNIYTGMNRTNHSLMNTIKNKQNNHTTDTSRVTYQIQQTDYFSALNMTLMIVYICLLILFAFLLYLTPTNMSMFVKIGTLILLLLLPYVSLLYYRYIV